MIWEVSGWLRSCKHTFYGHLSQIQKLTRFTCFIRKLFATKILLSGKFSLFVTLTFYCDYSDTKFAFTILLTATFFKNTLITIYRDILYAEKKNGSTNHILGAEAAEENGLDMAREIRNTRKQKYSVLDDIRFDMASAGSIWGVLSKTLSVCTLLAPFQLLSPTNMK